MVEEKDELNTETPAEKPDGASATEQPQDTAEADLNINEAETNQTVESGLPDEIDAEALRQEIENLQQQLDESTDKVLRAQADMENLRKRTARDVENAHKYALDKFLKELLPVIDSMELGISASGNADDIESLREGMDLTMKKFTDTLEKFGVSVVDPQGDKFDPEKHEAVSMYEVENAESGTVVTVMQKGYELNGRLVRPAMVVVAK